MTGSLVRLLDRFIDYAGLFPPAKLSMEEAVSSYLDYLSGPEEPFVSRFVCSVAKLDELRQVLANRSVSETISLGVVGTAPTDHAGWGDALVQDAEGMTRFMERVGEDAAIEAYEIRIPSHKHLSEYVQDLRSFNQVDVFCELPWGPEMADSLALLAEEEWLGAKARTGGLEASAFPPPSAVAEFLVSCCQLDLGFKLTAGLHHPLRGHREEVKAKMHGFLNIMVATSLIQAHDLNSKEVALILESESAADFKFDDVSIHFKDQFADLDAIDEARALFVGIGSCSVAEPLQDLKDLQLV